MILQEGILAPDFQLNATPDQSLRLSALRGKRVILAFYPADWSPVCGDQLDLFNATLKYFKNYNAQVIGISVDSAWSHQAFSKTETSTWDSCVLYAISSYSGMKGTLIDSYGVYAEHMTFDMAQKSEVNYI